MIGIGGQGIVLAGDILCHTAMNSGYDVKKTDTHGMSQRGGSVYSHIRYGQKVYSPVISKGDGDIIISFDLQETFRWLEYGNRNSKIIVLDNIIKPEGIKDSPLGGEKDLAQCTSHLYIVPSTTFSTGKIKAKFFNTGMLGLLSCFTEFSYHQWQNSFEAKLPSQFISTNWELFLKGRNYIKENYSPTPLSSAISLKK